MVKRGKREGTANRAIVTCSVELAEQCAETSRSFVFGHTIVFFFLSGGFFCFSSRGSSASDGHWSSGCCFDGFVNVGAFEGGNEGLHAAGVNFDTSCG